MKKIILIGLIAFSSLSASNSLIAKSSYPACVNEKTYKEFISVIVATGNFESLELFIKKGCSVIVKGTKMTIIERNWGTTKVMFFDILTESNRIMYVEREATE